MSENRFYFIDLARAFSIIWVVFIWHFNEILTPSFRYTGVVFYVLYNITISVLGCFSTISGLCLSKYQFSSRKEVINFYKKRFWRFYLLFALASLLMSVYYYGLPSTDGWKMFLYTITGFSLFCGKPMMTLWYMSMLLVFYLLTPLIKFRYKSHLLNVIVFALFFILLSLLYLKGLCDKRVLFYFPFYVFGLLSGECLMGNSLIIKRVFSLSALFISLAVFCVLCFFNCEGGLSSFLYIASGVILILGGFVRVKAGTIRYLVKWVSYSSLCIYLFHRLLFPVSLHFWGRGNLDGERYLPLAFSPFVILGIIGVSFLIQKGYDSLLPSIRKVK